jgi:hypothetical protein
MKNFVVLAAVLVATATTVHAQPALVAEMPAESVSAPGLVPAIPQRAEAPRMFVGAGAAVGGDEGGLYLDPSLELGYRLDANGALWAHAKLVGGNNFGIDETTHAGSRIVGSAGIETRPCVLDGAVCGVAGIDLGARHTYLDAEYDHVDVTDAVLIERLGFDVGTRHLRFRPDVEISESSTRALDGLALAAGVAYVW